jgi:hypothetical protein
MEIENRVGEGIRRGVGEFHFLYERQGIHLSAQRNPSCQRLAKSCKP